MSAPYPAWDAAFGRWVDARRAELAYEDDVLDPARDAGTVAAEMWEESDRLTNARGDLEDPVFDQPALNAEQLAAKILIAFDDDRDANNYLTQILRDCRRFASDELTRGPLSEGIEPWDVPDSNARHWLDVQRAAMIEAAAADENAPEYDRATERELDAIDKIMSPVPTTSDDVIAKLICIAQEVSFGGCPDVARAVATVQEAIAFFGMGYVSPNTLPDREAANG